MANQKRSPPEGMKNATTAVRSSDRERKVGICTEKSRLESRLAAKNGRPTRCYGTQRKLSRRSVVSLQVGDEDIGDEWEDNFIGACGDGRNSDTFLLFAGQLRELSEKAIGTGKQGAVIKIS